MAAAAAAFPDECDGGVSSALRDSYSWGPGVRNSAAAADASVAVTVRTEFAGGVGSAAGVACAVGIREFHRTRHFPDDAASDAAAFVAVVVGDEYSSHDIQGVIAADGRDMQANGNELFAVYGFFDTTNILQILI